MTDDIEFTIGLGAAMLAVAQLEHAIDAGVASLVSEPSSSPGTGAFGIHLATRRARAWGEIAHNHAHERDHRRLAAVYTDLLNRIASNETPSPDMPVNTLT